MDVSAVIVNWNTKDLTSQCIKSILQGQDRYRTEIILVDNASTDGSAEYFEKEFPEIRLIRNSQNLGFAKANNQGIMASSGRYICLLNSDVVILENCLEKLCDFLSDNPKVGLVGPKLLNADGTIQHSVAGLPTPWNTLCRALALDSIFPKIELFGDYLMKYREISETQPVDVIYGAMWVTTRQALGQVGLLDEQFFIFGEDLDWCKRFHDAGRNIVYLPLAQAIHHGGASSSKAPTRFHIEKQHSALQYWRKHYGISGQFYFLFVSTLRDVLRMFGYSVSWLLCSKSREKTKYMVSRAYANLKWMATHRS